MVRATVTASLPKRFPDRDEIAAVRAEADTLESGVEGEETRRLAGRVLARRDMGKLVFLDLVDRSGRIQLLCPAARTGEVDVHLGDVVGAIGKPTKSRRGEPSLIVDELVLLSRIRAPLPDTFHGLTDVEQRYRRRYLDLLMNEEIRADFILRARIVSAARRYLDDERIRRGRDARAAAAVRRRVRRAVRHAPQRARPGSLPADRDRAVPEAPDRRRPRDASTSSGKDFRNEGVNYKHNPEFTMLEWYEAYADYQDTMRRTESLIEYVALDALGTTKATFKGHEVDLKAPWRRVRLIDELQEFDLWTDDYDDLKERLSSRGVDVSQDKTWAQLIDKAITSYIEPRLIEPTILYDYPIELSPFARATDGDPRVVERFEYYVGGMELGNAFSELNDAEEQAERFAMQAEEGAGGNVEAEQGDPEYVEALSYGMPPTGGSASASTGWRWCWPARTRSGTSFSSRRSAQLKLGGKPRVSLPMPSLPGSPPV